LIIDDELPGTGCGLVDGFGDAGASIMATHELSTHHPLLSITVKIAITALIDSPPGR
jgi:hypothetical protein